MEKTSAFTSKNDLEYYQRVSGDLIRTEAQFFLSKQGALKKLLSPFTTLRPHCTYWVDWKPLTVKYWRKVPSEDLEGFCWTKLAVRCNFLDSPQDVFKYRPAVVPLVLYRKFFEESVVTKQEEKKLEHDCYYLFNSKNGSLQNPHPLMGEALDMMGLHERFGLRGYESIGDLPLKLFMVMKLVSRVQSSVLEINQQAESNRQQALKQFGGFVPPNERSLYEKPREE